MSLLESVIALSNNISFMFEVYLSSSVAPTNATLFLRVKQVVMTLRRRNALLDKVDLPLSRQPLTFFLRSSEDSSAAKRKKKKTSYQQAGKWKLGRARRERKLCGECAWFENNSCDYHTRFPLSCLGPYLLTTSCVLFAVMAFTSLKLR